jgi:hypothetical protein
MKSLFAFTVALSVLICGISASYAAPITLTPINFQAKPLSKSELFGGDSYALSKQNTVNSNLYVAAGDINIEGDISGDANLVGGNITVVSKVGGDLSAAGANVNISSNVAGDLKVIGGKVYINGNISGDLIVVGGEVFVSSNVKVGGVTKVYDKSAVDSNHDNLNSSVLQGAADWASIVSYAVFAIGSMITTAVIYFFFRGSATYVAMQASDRTSGHLIFGLLFMILAPIVLVLISLSGVGVYISLLSALLYIMLILVANSLTAITFGAIISRYIIKRNPSVDWSSVIVGSLSVILLSLIPYLGLAIKSMIFLSTFGVLVKYSYNKARE